MASIPLRPNVWREETATRPTALSRLWAKPPAGRRGSASRIARRGPGCERDDLDCNGRIDLADARQFIDAVLAAPKLTTCDAYTANVNADVLPDGKPKVDGGDVQAFVERLLAR